MNAREYVPRDLQDEIEGHILGVERCAVFAQPGSGKTIAALSALVTLAQFEPIWPALVVSTRTVARNVWPTEAKQWDRTAHLSVSPIIGTAQQRIDAAKTAAHIYTVNFDNVPWLVEKWGTAWPYRTIIVDESTRLAGYRIKQGKKRAKYLAARSWGNVRRFVELTGTPTINGLSKLWGPTYFLDRGAALGSSFDAFEQRYFYRGRDGHTLKAFPNALTECVQAIRHLAVSINLSDYVDLPPVVNVEIPVDLPATVLKKYRKFERNLEAEFDGQTITAQSRLTANGRLLQIAAGAVYPDRPDDPDGAPTRRRAPGEWLHVHDRKIEALDGLLEELNGAPLLVAYWWRSDLERLQKAYPFARVLTDDPAVINEWNAGRIMLLLANPGSAGHGLSLQHGGHAIAFFSLWYDGELYQQIIDRLGPMRQFQAGYTRRVFVYHLIARGTADERVMALLAGKQANDATFRRLVADSAWYHASGSPLDPC